jgi:exonuclease VII small subunit
METPLDTALDELEGVQLIADTPAEAKKAKQEIVSILKELYQATRAQVAKDSPIKD